MRASYVIFAILAILALALAVEAAPAIYAGFTSTPWDGQGLL